MGLFLAVSVHFSQSRFLGIIDSRYIPPVHRSTYNISRAAQVKSLRKFSCTLTVAWIYRYPSQRMHIIRENHLELELEKIAADDGRTRGRVRRSRLDRMRQRAPVCSVPFKLRLSSSALYPTSPSSFKARCKFVSGQTDRRSTTIHIVAEVYHANRNTTDVGKNYNYNQKPRLNTR